jgi:hypothetical protein
MEWKANNKSQNCGKKKKKKTTENAMKNRNSIHICCAMISHLKPIVSHLILNNGIR